MPEQIKVRLIQDEMKKSYIDYAMSVITARALPDVRDGLKPVHRRILYAMYKSKLSYTNPFRKSAYVVGRVLGSYHPHGDMAVYDSLVRMAQDFSLRYPLVQGHGNFGCFTKDTKVLLTDGRKLSFEELIKEHKEGKKNYTYTVNKMGNISTAEIKNPRLTFKDKEIMKVVLDNDEEIKCTLNHKFMLRDGTYKGAQNLKPGDSLMPLYSKLSENKDKINREGYVLIYQPKTGEWKPAHHLADNYNLTQGKYGKSEGRVRHHINFDKLNNNLDNIVRVKWEDHTKLHVEHASELHKNPEYRNKIAKGRKEFWDKKENKEEYSKRLSERNKLNWKNEEYREHMREFLSRVNKEYIKNHPEKRGELSKRATQTLKRLWQDENYKKKRTELMKKLWKDPKYCKDQSDRMKEIAKKIWSNPEHKKYISQKVKQFWKDTAYRENVIHTLSENGKKANYYRFIKVCRKTFEDYGDINAETYEKVRVTYNQRNGAGILKFNKGLERFFDNKIEKLHEELNIQLIKLNHKVKDIIFIKEKEDVYDLTVDNTHNFALASGVFVHNSIEGFPAASMRYTECRLAKLSDEILAHIDESTVKFIPNYDNTTKEPVVLPSLFPNLLVNGSSGIAVGMATNIPPHNLKEVIKGVIATIDNPDINVNELMKYIPGPDFPTGGIIAGLSGIKNAYETGRGKITVLAKCDIEEHKGKQTIIVKEIPYMVNKSLLIEEIADLVKDKRVEGISDLRDESDRKGMRIVIEIKQGFSADVVLNQLQKYSQLKTTFGTIIIALVDNEPKILTLKDCIQYYIKHRKEITVKRLEFELEKSRLRAHILLGIKVALNHIDAVVQTIKGSKDTIVAKNLLIERFKLSEKQAEAILEMRLQRLTSLETNKIIEEHNTLVKRIQELREILGFEKMIFDIIKKELIELSSKYEDERRTQISGEYNEIEKEDLVEEEDVVVTVTHKGYVKRLPVDTYRSQARGGKGMIGTETKEEDFVENLFVTSTHNYILSFTNLGRLYWLKAYEIPSASRYSGGKAIVNLLNLKGDERVTTMIPVKNFNEGYLVMATKKGLIKKTDLKSFSNPRSSGVICVNLNNDELVNVVCTNGMDKLIIGTKKGMAVKFDESDVRAMGRNATGVRGIKLKGKDEVVSLCVAYDNLALLTATENGYGKKSKIEDYRLIRRGGSGVINIKDIDRNGDVIRVLSVGEEDDIIFITEKGIVMRTSVKDISTIGRNTSGVRLIKLNSGDKLKSIAKVVNGE